MSLVERFMKEIGYTGLFSMEFIRGKDGKDYFLEINMRNDGNSYCATSAGCNLPFLFFQYMTTGIVPKQNKHIRKIYLIPDFADLGVAHQQGVSLCKWALQFATADAHTIFSWRDIGPFWCSFKSFIRPIIKKKLKMF